jgi:hypothetical protein
VLVGLLDRLIIPYLGRRCGLFYSLSHVHDQWPVFTICGFPVLATQLLDPLHRDQNGWFSDSLDYFKTMEGTIGSA